jgi:hypothetical protein
VKEEKEMHLSTISSHVQLKDFETQVSRVIQDTLDRRTSVFIDPKRLSNQLDYDGVRLPRKRKDIITLLFLLHYSDYFGVFRSYVIIEMQNYLNEYQVFPELNASLADPWVFRMVLCKSKMTDREIFGNILSREQINKVLNLISLRFNSKHIRVQRLVRRRGYKDKGSLRPSSKWLPSEDWSFREKQLEIEEKRQEYLDLVLFIIRESGGWVLKEQFTQQKGGMS